MAAQHGLKNVLGVDRVLTLAAPSIVVPSGWRAIR